MLPDMSDVLEEWSQPVILKTIVTTVDDNFDEVIVVTPETIRGVVQVAKSKDLNPDQTDWALRYITVHSKSMMTTDQYIEFQGTDYKIIQMKPWGQYGYYKAICEEVKGKAR